MSCGGSGVCGFCGGCGCSNCNYTIVVNENSGGNGLLGAQNANLVGIGFLDAVDNNTAYFRGAVSNNPSLTISLDATNHTLVLDLDTSSIVDNLPNATTTQRGVGETATDAEAQAKASVTVFLTPSNLAALGASQTFAGLIEISSDAEAIAGISTTLAITPANLAAVLAAGPSAQVFADSVDRAAATPAFFGQIGYQSNNSSFWVGYSLSPGGWLQILAEITPLQNAGQINLFGNVFAFNGISGSTSVQFNATVVDFSNSGLGAGGVVTNNALVGNDVGGAALAYPVSNFISTYNTQTGYTAFSNPATIRTCDTATVTLQQLAQIVGTLIGDLKAVKLPAT